MSRENHDDSPLLFLLLKLFFSSSPSLYIHLAVTVYVVIKHKADSNVALRVWQLCCLYDVCCAICWLEAFLFIFSCIVAYVIAVSTAAAAKIKNEEEKKTTNPPLSKKRITKNKSTNVFLQFYLNLLK